MKIHSPLVLLAALGALSAPAAAWAQADTGNWKCTSCPYPKGSTGTVDAGVGAVSDDSAKFGDYTGLQKKGAFLDLGGTLQYRGESGYFADVEASNLGLGSRSLNARTGREGLYSLRLAYSELPRHLMDGAQTPFLGVGGNTLSLPAGYPAASTATMPLAATLRPVNLGFNKKRLDLSGSWIALDHWTLRLAFSHDTREGTRPVYGSFFSTSSQLIAPVDQTTDLVEVSAAYVTKGIQGSLGYSVSHFTDGQQSLTWSNPFQAVVPGATQGQLALAPDSQFEQLTATAGYDIAPGYRVSGDIAFGRMTQNAPYLATTLNAVLAPSVPALPAASLDGRINTFNANLKLTASPIKDLRLTAVYARDDRANKTPIGAYPLLATDMFLSPTTRSNTPFSMNQDRLKLGADYRGLEAVKISAGADQDNRNRSYVEAVNTRETTVWARAGLQPLENLSLGLKAAHAERTSSGYGVATWFGLPDNPLMRKYNLADRKRDLAGARADWALNEKMSLGLSVDYANDDYSQSAIGLGLARDLNVALDFTAAIGEKTTLTAYAQGESIRSRQAGSQAYSVPDWTGQNKDQFDVVGVNVKHALIPDKLDIGADLTLTRSRSNVTVATAADATPLPNAKNSTDRLKLNASYKLSETLWLNGSWWYERYESNDWHLDGVLPGTVGNLLSLGQQSPSYRVNVVTLSLRYKF